MKYIIIQHRGKWTVLLLLAPLFFPFQVRGWEEQEEPPPVECVEGPTPIGFAYGNHTTGCEISPATDHDMFRFTGSSGDRIRVIVSGTSGYLDPHLEIRDDCYGTLIVDNWCDAGYYPCSFQVDEELTEECTYTMTVYDEGINDTGTYILQLEKIPPAYDPPRLGYDSPVIDSINPITDEDFIEFDAVAGTDLRINVLGTSGYFDPRLEVWAPDGTRIVQRYCDAGYYPCSFQVDDPELKNLALSGTYLMAISDHGSNDPGGYQITLECLFGPCPLCTDNDADGYGNPASPHCSYPELDCDDTDPGVNPTREENNAAGNCTDGKDNDCDGLMDTDDPDCASPGPCAGAAEASVPRENPIRMVSVYSLLPYLLLPGVAVFVVRVLRRRG